MLLYPQQYDIIFNIKKGDSFKMQTNQYTFNKNDSNKLWKSFCEEQNLEPLHEYNKSTDLFYFRFKTGKFKGLVGKTYWGSIKRNSKMLMSCLTEDSKNEYFHKLGEDKGIHFLENYKNNRRVKHTFIVTKGKYKGCEGQITLNDLEFMTKRIDNRSLTKKGKKQYFDKKAKKRQCEILEYPKDYKIRTKDRIVVKDREGNIHYLIVQDFFDKDSILELSFFSEGEKLVKEVLKDLEIDFIKEKGFINSIGRTQRFDFYFIFKDKKCVIEYNGRQHYEECTGYYGDSYELTRKRDLLKYKYCEKENINLLIIPYTRKTYEEVKEDIANFLSTL